MSAQGITQTQNNVLLFNQSQSLAQFVQGPTQFPSHEWYAGSKVSMQITHQILCVNDRNRETRRCHIGKISLKR